MGEFLFRGAAERAAERAAADAAHWERAAAERAAPRAALALTSNSSSNVQDDDLLMNFLNNFSGTAQLKSVSQDFSST